ncbi:MAG: tetrahydrofolate dehydrogenase/cyclohydrolase catalytic domain-containing protein [Clostridium sp.]|uniref:tetrahydrofolate dehydrogenase/cyclohydrolase catalytic domain-containing protein n=1 Tax=Clostridium sp. TaxID=1506 RepID=UPI003EE44D21
MLPILINANSLKNKEIASMQEEVNKIVDKIGRKPKLVIVKATDDKACEAYVRNKVKVGAEVGMEVEVLELDKDTTDIRSIIHMMDTVADDEVDGVILQLPIYDHLDKDSLIGLIRSNKDADCFSDINLGKLMQGKSDVLPCTPGGVVDIFKHHQVKIEGARVTIVGRSTHVGLSLGVMLTQLGAVVKTSHSKSPSLEEDVRDADIVVSCVGKQKLIKPEWMKRGSVILGVGIDFVDGKQYTDYDIEDMLANSKCSLIGNRISCTGTATVLNLIKNTIKLCKIRKGI